MTFDLCARPACEMLTALISPPELLRRRTPLPCCVDATAVRLIVQCTALSVAVWTEAADK